MPDRGHRLAPRRHEPRTVDEDRRVLAAEPRTLRALAIELGRTHTGVTRRRYELRRRERKAEVMVGRLERLGEAVGV